MTQRKYPTGRCRHCKQMRLLRPRDLCSTHYEDLAIRALYPTRRAPSNNRGAGLDDVPGVVPYSLPPSPTLAAPGTEEKLRVMAERLKKRQSLSHPDDIDHHGFSLPTDVLLPIQFGDRSGGSSRSRARAAGKRTCSRCRSAPVDGEFRCCQTCRENMNEYHARRKRAKATG